MDNKGYYKLLGVDETATKEDIKKAFRKLSMIYHPDRAPDDKEAEEKFKQINDAYSILSDEQKRREYDNPINPLDSFFGHSMDPGFGGMNFFTSRAKQDFNRPRRGRDLKYMIHAPLIKFIFGGTEELNVSYDDICPTCAGKRFSTTKICDVCNGTGMITQMSQQGNVRMQSHTTCRSCGGTGETGVVMCESCSGNGFITKELNKVIDIPVDSKDGLIIHMSGFGGSGVFGGPPGDLYIKLDMILPESTKFTEEQKDKLRDMLS